MQLHTTVSLKVTGSFQDANFLCLSIPMQTSVNSQFDVRSVQCTCTLTVRVLNHASIFFTV